MILPDRKFWQIFASIPGALSCAEALAIMQLCKNVPSGTYIELGSHKGRSYLAASMGLKKGTFHLVDPIFEDDQVCAGLAKLFYELPSTHIEKKLHAAYSYEVIPKFGPYAYCFWDSGEHGGEVLWRETALLEDAIIPGGYIVSHDIGNQFTQQTEAMERLVATGKYEWVHIDWPPILAYVKDNNLTDGESWHVYPDLPHSPNFVGAIRRK